MPARESPGPKFQEGLNKHPISLCSEHAGGEAVASGGQRAERHPKTRPERFCREGASPCQCEEGEQRATQQGAAKPWKRGWSGACGPPCAPSAEPPQPLVAWPPMGCCLFSMHHPACLGAFRAITGGNRQESCPRACLLTEVSPWPLGRLLGSSYGPRPELPSPVPSAEAQTAPLAVAGAQGRPTAGEAAAGGHP